MTAEVRVSHIRSTDGFRLGVDVYMPDCEPIGAVLTRTPYGRRALSSHGRGWARHGFVYAVQDVRGRYGSEGEWSPYVHEVGDGGEFLQWALAQEWSRGGVILAGASYGAFTAWAMARDQMAGVRGVISEVPAGGLRAVKVDSSGILRLAEHVGWSAEHGDGPTSKVGAAAALLLRRPTVLSDLPVSKLGSRLGSPRWWSVTSNLLDDSSSGDGHVPDVARIDVPTLHIGGWYDLFLRETLHFWSDAGSAVTPRPARTLVVGPWHHGLSSPFDSRAGGRTHGPQSQINLGKLQVDWVVSVLSGGARARDQIYLVGSDVWLDEWPPHTHLVRFHPRAAGLLTSKQAAGHSAAVTFTYNPNCPYPGVPLYGEPNPPERHANAVYFTTRSLAAPLSICGTPAVNITGSSTAPDVDWVVRLAQRFSDGSAVELTRGCANSTTGTAAFALNPLSVTLCPGSMLEMHVSTSDFPRLARNLNTGDCRYTTTATRMAVQTLLVGDPDITYVNLPILETPRGIKNGPG